MARILVRNKEGQPGVTMRSQSYGALRVFNNPIFRKRSVRTLIKRDESKGRTMPEFSGITDQKGVDTGRGFAASPNRVLSEKRTAVAPYKNKRTVSKAGSGPIKNRKNGT